jgi:hypothetical protein
MGDTDRLIQEALKQEERQKKQAKQQKHAEGRLLPMQAAATSVAQPLQKNPAPDTAASTDDLQTFRNCLNLPPPLSAAQTRPARRPARA